MPLRSHPTRFSSDTTSLSGEMMDHVHVSLSACEVPVLQLAVEALQEPSDPFLQHHGDGETLDEHDDFAVGVDLVDGVAHERY